MAIVNAHMSILMLTSMKSDLEAKIMQISQRRQLIGTQEAMVIMQTQDIAASLSDNSKYQVLEIQDNMLDIQQKQYETKLKAVDANMEAQQKLLDSNIKEDFSPKMTS